MKKEDQEEKISIRLPDIKDKRIKQIKKVYKKSDQTIQEALSYCIRKRFKIDFYYEEKGPGGEEVLAGYRNVSPVALGTHKSSGNKVFRAYLNEGTSKSKKSPKWRLFRVDRVQQFAPRFNKFRENSMYRMNDKHMSEIDVQIIKKCFWELIQG
jgi:predicted DNA-binding transcriptional regulator YafY